MLSKISRLILLAVIIFYLFHFLFFWMFQTTDSYFFWALSNFIKTGRYFVPYPYNFNRPSTMEPPLYSLFIYIAEFFPRADIVLHLIQICSILISGYLIYKTLKKFIGTDWAQIVGVLFTIIPANIIYVSNMMSESIALFFVSLYLYLSYKILSEKKTYLLKYLLILSSFMVLQRYGLISFFLSTWFLTVWFYKKGSKDYFGMVAGIGIIIVWVLINYHLTKGVGISNGTGKNLYNRIVWRDGLLPESSNQNLQKLKLYTVETDVRQPYWNLESRLVAKLGNETAADGLFLNVAIAAFLKNPIQYFVNIPASLLRFHKNGIPFHYQVYATNGLSDATCDQIRGFSFCTPIISKHFARRLWISIVQYGGQYYSIFPIFINLFLLLPALVYSFFQKNKFVIFSAIVYITGAIFPAMVVHEDTRYIYLLYPVKTILITLFILLLVKIIKGHFKSVPHHRT